MVAARNAVPMMVWKRLHDGDEPDPRFSLANERTYLSWVRTSLGLIATALAVQVFGAEALAPWVATSLAIAMLVAGALLSLGALVQWFRVQRALRARQPLPVPWIVPLLTLLIVTMVVGLLVASVVA